MPLAIRNSLVTPLQCFVVLLHVSMYACTCIMYQPKVLIKRMLNSPIVGKLRIVLRSYMYTIVIVENFGKSGKLSVILLIHRSKTI